LQSSSALLITSILNNSQNLLRAVLPGKSDAHDETFSKIQQRTNFIDTSTKLKEKNLKKRQLEQTAQSI
jgi:hypothetical protein